MVEDLGVPSEKILVLLLNRTNALEWRNKLNLKSSGKVWRTSYFGFLQSELNTYYPIVLENCEDILKKRIKPLFLSLEASQFLVSKVIENRRERLGIFAGVTAFSDKIAIELIANLVKAASSEIPFNEIGHRLFKSLEYKEAAKKQILTDADGILNDYKKKCVELGIFDFGMAMELYNNCLLKDDVYIEKLFQRVQHLIVDNIEECVPSEANFVSILLPSLASCFIGYNNEGGYGEIFGSNHEYVKQKIIGRCETIDLRKSFTCSEYMSEFSEMFFDKILKKSQYETIGRATIPINLKNKTPLIERTPSFELRSDMLDAVGDRVCRLINFEDCKPSDIVILSTYADTVTEYVIGRIIEKQGFRIKNLSKKSRVIDNPFSLALITLAQICHPSYGVFPNRDDIKALFVMVLNIDPIRSSILTNEVCRRKPLVELPDIRVPKMALIIGESNALKYEYIRNWIIDYKASAVSLPISEFFQKAFLEILISKEIAESEMHKAKNLIEFARDFTDIVARFNRNANKDFLEVVKCGMKSAENIFELEEELDGEFVNLTTPLTYLASSLKNKVIILTSISSKNWSPRSMKELTNPHVLSKTWDTDLIYTEEMEEENQINYLAILMRSILKRCGERLITFESDLSANGFENDGILGDYFNGGQSWR